MYERTKSERGTLECSIAVDEEQLDLLTQKQSKKVELAHHLQLKIVREKHESVRIC